MMIMYQSNRSFDIPPRGIPRAFDAFSCPGGREFDEPLIGGGEFDRQPRCHVTIMAETAETSNFGEFNGLVENQTNTQADCSVFEGV